MGLAQAAPDRDEWLSALHQRYHDTADPEARAELLEAYRALAHHLARRFERRGEPLEDLEQVAVLALVKALDRFDPDREVKFSTYGAKVVIGELKRHFRDHGWSMRVPRSLQELHLRLKGAVESLHGDLGRSPTVSELAEYLGVSTEDVLAGMEAGTVYRLRSLDAPVRGLDGDGYLEVGTAEPGYDWVERDLTRQQLLEPLLERLSGEDRRVLELYFGESLSQAEIGARLGMSQVAVSRRIDRILSRLRAFVPG